MTAFTQLALLRLGAHRAFISLFDCRYQYVIAETTATSALKRAVNQQAEEKLLFCGLALPYGHGVSSHVLQVASDSLAASIKSGETKDEWQMSAVVVPDLQADNRFVSDRVLLGVQDIRFYAAIPIHSPSGPFIGILSVTDNKPRDDLSTADAEFLRELSCTIMDHLVLNRYKQGEVRGKRMIRGLGSFIEGRTTMTGLAASSLSSSAEGDGGQEGMLNVAQQRTMQSEIEDDDGKHDITSSDLQAPQSYFESDSSLNPLSSASAGAERHTSVAAQTQAAAQTQQRLGRHTSKPPSPAGSNKSAGNFVPLTETSSPTPLQMGIRSLFSRAANTIREAIEVEGVLFFDASIATFGGMLDSDRQNSSEPGDSHASQSPSSGEENVQSLKTRGNVASSNPKMCDLFGFSTTQTASIDGDKPNSTHLAVPERFLHLLLRRYPKGKIFNFDENGIPVSDTESDSDNEPSARDAAVQTTSGSSDNRSQRRQSFARSKEPSFIIKIFPSARSVIAFPLWDSHRLRWYAGGVAWTRKPDRIFSVQGELSYLRAFGATIMAEVAKIDALQSDQAKTDVLGSISHELRSPLHGILGGVELLHGTDMDVFQDSTVHGIENCGMTLLDTIDHLLDYAKINNFMRVSKAQRQTQKREGGNQASTGLKNNSFMMTRDVDVDAVVEEVMESIFAGHEFGSTGRSIDAPEAGFTSIDPNVRDLDVEMLSKVGRTSFPETVQNQVRIVFDIQTATSWRFALQPGAIRRIVMNLFGNALKYTTAGFIRVILDQKDLLPKGSHKAELKITVEDTGRGIGKEYLAHHLYTPFLQEDSFSPGTGLGLAVTHKIVTSLGGTMHAQSEVGKGTKMFVSLPLTRSVNPETSPTTTDFITLRSRTQGLRVVLAGFDETVVFSAQGSSKENQSWQLPRATIEHQCQAWLRMHVLPETATDVKTDVYVATLAGAAALAQMNQAGAIIQPVVVICPNLSVARHLNTTSQTVDRNGIFEYVSQP